MATIRWTCLVFAAIFLLLFTIGIVAGWNKDAVFQAGRDTLVFRRFEAVYVYAGDFPDPKPFFSAFPDPDRYFDDLNWNYDSALFVQIAQMPFPGRFAYRIPLVCLLPCIELPLALFYLWAFKADRNYVLRRRRLAAWRASQRAFPVEPGPPARQ